MLRGIDFTIPPGRIYGLVGHNGAGKTTTLNALLGLIDCGGQIEVLGLDPFRNRARLMNDVAFVSDVASLPRFLRVRELFDLIEDIHPRFSREKANVFLQGTDLRPELRIKTLSKGMVAQLHLAVVMAIDAKLLVLDEPTLGLDITYRKRFYRRLLEDFMTEERTLLITTHQVDEIEFMLTDIMFMKDGAIVLDAPTDVVRERYRQVVAGKDAAAGAALGPIYSETRFGQTVMMFDGVPERQAHPARGGVVADPQRSLRCADAARNRHSGRALMRATIALIKRELLEHRGAFVYAPAVLVGVLILAIVYSLLSGRADFNETPTNMSSAITIYQIALGGTFGLLVGLCRARALLLLCRQLFGGPAQQCAAVLEVDAAERLQGARQQGARGDHDLSGAARRASPSSPPSSSMGRSSSHPRRCRSSGRPDRSRSVSSLVQMTFVGTIYMFLSILWSAPFLAWVAGLSTLFRRWSIPLALLIPGAVVLLEFLNSLRNGTRDDRPIAEFLAWRLDMIADERALFAAVIGPDSGGPMQLLTVILNSVNWMHMGVGDHRCGRDRLARERIPQAAHRSLSAGRPGPRARQLTMRSSPGPRPQGRSVTQGHAPACRPKMPLAHELLWARRTIPRLQIFSEQETVRWGRV